ncbi:superfamily protein DNA and RNA helicase [Lactobacillus selangorensis]|uniref:Superfamily protein DNA and RNA helicase n=1 Tax=Lactobacillus selangorensis TaxID=81857 RepID=A0A0R2FSU5_9LACO|nr:RNA polymerase recycling motor HelD [Lactobacillus selangorensis]KRN28204.1 superfamily protein DNA and RNA helicase [Lactobacillus selangorensis]KRN30920.1 superfamily protein DNA and RNA helicase [Lactobacillus selangorensis]
MAKSERELEQQHLDSIVQQIKTAEQRETQDIARAKKDEKRIQDDFFDGVKLNYSNYTEALETASSIQEQQQLLMERNNAWQNSNQQLDVLKKLEQNPYFARIDFQEKGENGPETIYIGLGSFADENDHFLIYDWRAPISSIYYDGGIGKVTYQTPDGPQEVSVNLKRQFLIDHDKITAMFDTTETIGDQMLLEVLDEKSSTQMKSIVTTIQREQNKIIRDTTSDLLFVQGAAGSGKTSAVLQRVAYLLYRYRGNLKSSQVIMFSPNQLFNDYIENVLPELGEQNMVQMTYFQYAAHRLPKISVENIYQQFETPVSADQKTVDKYKTDLAFFKVTQKYAARLNERGMRFRDIKLKGEVFFSKEKIAEIYYSFNENYHLGQRLSATKEKLLQSLNRKVSHEMKKEWVSQAIQSLSDDQIRQLKSQHKGEFKSGDDEEKFYACQIVTLAFRQVQRAIQRNHFLTIQNQYLDFLRQVPRITNLEKLGITTAMWKKSIQHYIDNMQQKQISMADVTPYLHLYDLMVGKHGDRSMRFVFIDEIQDYTPYQLAFLQFNFPKARFTLLGDLNQAIFTKDSSNTLLNEVQRLFKDQTINVVQLTQSYRSTAQITDFTKDILKSGQKIEAFNRDGDLPVVAVEKTKEESLARLVEQLRANDQDKYTTAIITKTMEEAEQVYADLRKKQVKTTLIKSENQRLADGTIIVPSYLAKGLEFDAVVVWEASQANYHEDDERQLLYTIASRAMHRLTLIATQELSPLLKQVAAQTYTLEQK